MNIAFMLIFATAIGVYLLIFIVLLYDYFDYCKDFEIKKANKKYRMNFFEYTANFQYMHIYGLIAIVGFLISLIKVLGG